MAELSLAQNASATSDQKEIERQEAEFSESSEQQDLKPDRPISATPDDVSTQLSKAEERFDALFTSPLLPLHNLWAKGNNWLEQKVGLKLALNYTVLYQRAGSDDGMSGDFDFLGKWKLFDFNGRWPASITFSTELRHRFLPRAPSKLGKKIDSLWGTTVNFDTQDFALVELYWEQGSYSDGFLARVGKMDPGLIYDGGRYVSEDYAFLSPGFSDTPSMAMPDAGFGAAAAVYTSDNTYILAGIHDANAVRTQGIDTFGEGDFFSALELGFTPKYGEPGSGDYHLTLWYSDKKNEQNSSSGRGFALTFEQELGAGGNIVPFMRYSYGDGGATEVRQTLSVGIGFEEILGHDEDVAALGFSWGQPEDNSLRDQYLVEIFYKFFLTSFTHFTPDVQAIINPSRAPGKDVEWVFSLRLRTVF